MLSYSSKFTESPGDNGIPVKALEPGNVVVPICRVQADFEVIDQRTVAHEYILCIEKRIGTWLRAYAKAINERYHRHRSLFQRHTEAKLIHEKSYFLTLITYIHQNAVHSELVEKIEAWQYASY